jgi:hypothetical protein
VVLYHLPHRLNAGDHHGGDLAELQVHHWPVPATHLCNGAVRERTDDVVEAADDRESPWPRRQRLLLTTGELEKPKGQQSG